MFEFRFWLRIASLLSFCALTICLFVISCCCSYQHEWIKANTDFEDSMFAMDMWKHSPFGKLKIYIFNVTNAENYLNGRDEKIHLQQIGPITYDIKSYNYILHRAKDSVKYQKERFRYIDFVPYESISPDILSKTIIQFNKRFSFLSSSINDFLHSIFRPLNNIFERKDEDFTVNIGPKHGMENFFRILTLNGEHSIKTNDREIFNEGCPINVQGAFDNSLFPPFITKNTSLNIFASELCRVVPLHYQREEMEDGLKCYRYLLLRPNEAAPDCLSEANGVRLPKGMFNIRKCLYDPWHKEEVSLAFSAPHFYGSSYNWSKYFEGLNPNTKEHEAFILLEPTTGIPINERLRFQSNTILKSDTISKFPDSPHMIVPRFWYDFEMAELPFSVRFGLYIYVSAMPVLQPMIMVVSLLGAIWSLYKIGRLILQRKRAAAVAEGGQSYYHENTTSM
ncbi:sensory neuron membrane protein 1-like [Drosophila sulfurigaster albostrigata]|uniref:sensory neuron membrane protein 1-like n=1 Tax=Drosophila sulfurigaster albostrigata TaxID=89887 RepID=UPI002D21E3F3|nr:sensory neuron membrane protein 1-like [Drosophila sulfurigaster albostrigata]